MTRLDLDMLGVKYWQENVFCHRELDRTLDVLRGGINEWEKCLVVSKGKRVFWFCPFEFSSLLMLVYLRFSWLNFFLHVKMAVEYPLYTQQNAFLSLSLSLFHFHLLSLSGVAKEPGLKVGQKEKGQDVRRHSSYIFPFPVLYVSTSIHFPVVAVTNYQHHKLWVL